MEPILFVNIAWMKYYRGPRADDPLHANGFDYFRQDYAMRESTLKEGRNKVGNETWNFLPVRGRMFAGAPRDATPSFTRLGGAADADEVGGILVVFISRDPIAGCLKVVGWYRNATIRREPDIRMYKTHRIERRISAAAADCVPLPVGRRTISIPSAKLVHGGVGQSPFWYGTGHPDVVARVRRLVSARAAPDVRKPKKAPRQPDTEKRKQVEAAAMKAALRYFGGDDVSSECLGWDIDATDEGGPLYIEVKGLSGPTVNFELTPQEYEKLQLHKSAYVLFVLTSALTKHPRPRIFRYRSGSGRGASPYWGSDDAERLIFQDRVGARCTI